MDKVKFITSLLVKVRRYLSTNDTVVSSLKLTYHENLYAPIIYQPPRSGENITPLKNQLIDKFFELDFLTLLNEKDAIIKSWSISEPGGALLQEEKDIHAEIQKMPIAFGNDDPADVGTNEAIIALSKLDPNSVATVFTLVEKMLKLIMFAQNSHSGMVMQGFKELLSNMKIQQDIYLERLVTTETARAGDRQEMHILHKQLGEALVNVEGGDNSNNNELLKQATQFIQAYVLKQSQEQPQQPQQSQQPQQPQPRRRAVPVPIKDLSDQDILSKLMAFQEHPLVQKILETINLEEILGGSSEVTTPE
jgi:hypothetical protein